MSYSKILFTYEKNGRVFAMLKEQANQSNQISKSIKYDKSLSEVKNHEKGALALMKKMQAIDEDVTYQEVTPVLTQDFMDDDYRETWQLVYCYN